MDNRCIGIFDSGLGGLTAVKEIKSILPNENLIYLGDTGRVPYGTRSEETIIKYSCQDIDFLKSHNVKLIVVACGTVSSVALPKIKQSDVPVIGVVDATSNAAIKATKSKKIGIIGTPGTIKSNAYSEKILSKDNSIKTYSKACPLFVPLVENGHFDTEVARLIVKEYLEQIKENGVDTLILGCTHYPLLKKVIGEFMGDEVTLIDAGQEIAKEVKLKFSNLLSDNTEKGECKYYVSDNIENFENLASLFLQSDINGQVTKIDIENY